MWYLNIWRDMLFEEIFKTYSSLFLAILGLEVLMWLWGLSPRLLLVVYSVRLLMCTISLQRGPLEHRLHRSHAPIPGLMTVGGMESNS